MIFNKLKKAIANKMKRSSPYLHDIPDSPRFGRGMGIYNRGKYDPSDESGHGMRKNQGLTKYIEAMLEAEKSGKYRFDTRR